MLSADLDFIGLPNPLGKYDYEKLLIKNFWNGRFFIDDLSGKNKSVVCGDSQVMPFWTGVVKDRSVLRKAFSELRKEGLDKPFPLKYTSFRISGQKMIFLEKFAGNYERDAVWAHIGLLYLKLLFQVDVGSAKKGLGAYTAKIKKYRTFLEVYVSDGLPFQTWLYCSDEGMLWCANYLSMCETGVKK
jgi:hypothetical protein